MISVDRPGWADSFEAGLLPSLHSQAQTLARVLDSASPEQLPAIVVGLSYGGPVSAFLAMEEPRRVGAMEMVAGSIDPQLEIHLEPAPKPHAPGTVDATRGPGAS